jgi:hypothetical protein
MEGRGEMIKAPIDLQDLRRRLYVKAKAEPSWRFWGIYVHVCKMETLRKAYALAKANNGAPGIDGVTFEVIERQGTEYFLEQIRGELIQRTYVPLKARQRENTQGWRKSPRAVDTGYPGSRGSGCAEANFGADLRSARRSLVFSAGENPAPERGRATPPGIEPWTHGGNDMG